MGYAVKCEISIERCGIQGALDSIHADDRSFVKDFGVLGHFKNLLVHHAFHFATVLVAYVVEDAQRIGLHKQAESASLSGFGAEIHFAGERTDSDLRIVAHRGEYSSSKHLHREAAGPRVYYEMKEFGICCFH